MRKANSFTPLPNVIIKFARVEIRMDQVLQCNQRIYFDGDPFIKQKRVVALSTPSTVWNSTFSGANLFLCDAQGNLVLNGYPITDLMLSNNFGYTRQFNLENVELTRSYITYNGQVSPAPNLKLYIDFYYSD